MLRELFGPSRDEIWHGLMKQLSTDTGGRLVPGLFGRGAGDKVQVTHGQWTVTLDFWMEPIDAAMRFHRHYQPPIFTRVRAPYVNLDGFRFALDPTNSFTGVAKWFGMQDIEVDDREFDDDFVVKGNDESKVRKLFSNQRVRDLLKRVPAVRLAVKDNDGLIGVGFPEGTDELCLTAPGYPDHIEPFKILYDLFAETLDELCRMGSAYDKAPDVAL
jgi:hypothetical protein